MMILWIFLFISGVICGVEDETWISNETKEIIILSWKSFWQTRRSLPLHENVLCVYIKAFLGGDMDMIHARRDN